MSLLRLNLTILLTALFSALAMAGCSDNVDPGSQVSVVATTDIVADWATNVGGDRVSVFSLLGPGDDPHNATPGAQDVARVAGADLILTVGLGLEAGWLDKLIATAAADESRVVALGGVVDPLELSEGDGVHDPHFWFDPVRVKLAIAEIAARLSASDPEGAVGYRTNADAYLTQLDELNAWVEAQIAEIPEARRLLLTSHESLGYLADRYGLEIVGTVIPGVTTETDPSAKEITDLVDLIRERNVAVVFTEPSVSDRLARTIAEEAGVSVVRDLYTGSLGGSESGAETYVDMMRVNVEAIVEVLR